MRFRLSFTATHHQRIPAQGVCREPDKRPRPLGPPPAPSPRIDTDWRVRLVDAHPDGTARFLYATYAAQQLPYIWDPNPYQKLFANEDFGYWKVTVDRPLRLAGIDAERSYTVAEIKELRAEHAVDPGAPPVIKLGQMTVKRS
jgi:hypothetical protein